MVEKSWIVPPQFKIVKGYPPVGDNRQYRLAKTATFTCCRCNQQKMSDLVATEHGKWDSVLCDNCYRSSVPNAAGRRGQSPRSSDLNLPGRRSNPRQSGLVNRIFGKWFGRKGKRGGVRSEVVE